MRFEKFSELISNISHIPEEYIKEKASFRNDLGIDSLQMVNLFVELSERTGIGFDQFVRAKDLETVGGVYQIILRGIQNEN